MVVMETGIGELELVFCKRRRLKMKKLISIISMSLFALALSTFIVGPAHAQTVLIQRSTELGQDTVNSIMSNRAFSAANPQYMNWINVAGYNRICFEIDFVDANSSITSVDMQCWSATVGAVGAVNPAVGYALQVYVSTAATGITTSVDSVIRHTSTTGLAPGTSRWEWCVTNLPTSMFGCGFTANGVITANIDILQTVKGRLITP